MQFPTLPPAPLIFLRQEFSSDPAAFQETITDIPILLHHKDITSMEQPFPF